MIIAFTAALVWNETNFYYLKKTLPEKIRDDATIRTNDDVSYLSPAKHFYDTGVWKDNSPGRQSYFLRPPGYGLLYLIFIYVFGAGSALVALKYFQLLLFSVSAVLLYRLAAFFTADKKIKLLLFLLYGVSPFAIGFLYYTLTEAITPALVIGYSYFLFAAFFSKSLAQKRSYYLIAALILCFLLLVRPVLGVLGIAFFGVLAIEKWQPKIKIIAMFFYGGVSLSGLAGWEIRNYGIAKEFVGLHPIYYAEANTIYRLPHEKIWEFYECWNIPNEKYHAMMTEIWENAIKGDTATTHLNMALALIPADAIQLCDKEKIIAAFKQYQTTILWQKIYYDQDKPMPAVITVAEKEVAATFVQFKNQYAAAFPFRYYVLVPIKNYFRLSLHSNLSLYIFQHTFRGAIWAEVIRYFFFALHSLLYLSFPFFIFLNHKNKQLLVFSAGALIYIILLVAFFKDWEERYTLPVLPIIFIVFFYAISKSTFISDRLNLKKIT